MSCSFSPSSVWRCASTWLEACGLHPRPIYQRVKNIWRFYNEYKTFKALYSAQDNNAPLSIAPILHDYNDSAGSATGHYFHQDIWAARKIFQNNAARHVDIGSRLDGFVSHLMVFRAVEVVDIRVLSSHAENLHFVQADATLMAGFEDNSLPSISSLHAAEHFGLGRYGDPLDPNGHIKFIQSLQRVLQPNGRLYFSVPIGKESVAFNAHRIFAPQKIVDLFGQLCLVSFSAVNDDGNFIKDAQMSDYNGSIFSCGLYEFTK